jgi:hypothetical protein
MRVTDKIEMRLKLLGISNTVARIELATDLYDTLAAELDEDLDPTPYVSVPGEADIVRDATLPLGRMRFHTFLGLCKT